MERIESALLAAGVTQPPLEMLRSTDAGEVYVTTIRGGERAVELWERLRPELAKIGCCAVITSDDPAMLRDRQEYCGTVSSILAEAEKLDAERWLKARERQRLEEFLEFNPGEDPADFTPPIGDWPDEGEVAPISFTTPFDILTSKPKKTVRLAIVPTMHSWQAAAFLAFGGWNECPQPHEQCAMFKHWHDRYGAEIVAMTDDVVECFVARPPDNQQLALSLARQQYIFCADIVEQGTETIAALAAALLDSPIWYFWWD